MHIMSTSHALMTVVLGNAMLSCEQAYLSGIAGKGSGEKNGSLSPLI